MYRPLICLILAFSLPACSGHKAAFSRPLEQGANVRLTQEFTHIVNGGHIDFQMGQPVASGDLDRWTTWCRLYVYDQTRDADYRITLEPGNFRVGAVTMGYRSSEFPNWPVHGIGFFPRGVREVPSYYLYRVGMPLTSPEQPELRSLDCYKKWATPDTSQFPTLAEIREAVGNHLEMIQPTAPAM